MRILLPFLFGVLFFVPSFSQRKKVDSLTDIRVKNVIDLYNKYTDGNAPVYNGRGYLYYTFRMRGNPFFQTDGLSPGWLSYEGKKYESLSLLYDLTRNEVVVLLPDSNSRVVLHNEFLDSFNIAGHTFIDLNTDREQNLYNTGFYDLLYDGHVKLLARRTKLMQEDLRENPVVTDIFSKDFFYIYKEGLYYLVTNQKDIFRLLSDKKREIKRMMREQHLKLNRKTFENTLVIIVPFYDHLIR